MPAYHPLAGARQSARRRHAAVIVRGKTSMIGYFSDRRTAMMLRRSISRSTTGHSASSSSPILPSIRSLSRFSIVSSASTTCFMSCSGAAARMLRSYAGRARAASCACICPCLTTRGCAGNGSGGSSAASGTGVRGAALFRTGCWRPALSDRVSTWGIALRPSASARTAATVLWSTWTILAIARSERSGLALSSFPIRSRFSIGVRVVAGYSSI